MGCACYCCPGLRRAMLSSGLGKRLRDPARLASGGGLTPRVSRLPTLLRVASSVGRGTECGRLALNSPRSCHQLIPPDYGLERGAGAAWGGGPLPPPHKSLAPHFVYATVVVFLHSCVLRSPFRSPLLYKNLQFFPPNSVTSFLPRIPLLPSLVAVPPSSPFLVVMASNSGGHRRCP